MAQSFEPPDFPASQLFLRRLAYSLVHDEARAEDLVQDTWAAWAEHRPKNLVEPRAWLTRVLRNRAFNEKRAAERRASREASVARPDPSAPETEGTLEAQARLIEALRQLDEPYRSTLVQRYYHDLAPKAIAERTGTSIDTVKARLARGLKRLRAELDRRYGGDRGAWCHWLTVLGASASPIALPPGAAAPGAPLVGLGASASPLSWWGVGLLLAAGAAWKAWPRTPRVEVAQPPALSETVEPRESRETNGDQGRVPVVSEERDEEPENGVIASRPREPHPALPKKLTQLVPATVSARPSGERVDFEWPQYAGGAEHDNYRVLEDEIFSPKVLWFVPGCVGQPTLSDGDLYSGGCGIWRIDPATGAVLEVKSDLEEEFRNLSDSGQLESFQREVQKWTDLAAETQDPNDIRWHRITGSPVITRRLVIARRLSGGGVLAFDRALEKLVWSWPPEKKLESVDGRWAQVPLCLTSDDLVLVPHGSLVALNVATGEEVWRFNLGFGRIDMVPACADGRVFFGTDHGFLFALHLGTGTELWRTRLGEVGWTSPTVVGKRVLAVDYGRWEQVGPTELELDGGESDHGHLCALDVKSGKELWRTAFEGHGLSTPGVGAKREYVVAGFGREVARFALSSGKRDKQHRVKTGRHPFGSPTVVGKSLVFGDLDGSLYVHDLETGELRWTFRPSGAKVYDFVHTGKRIFVSTSIGLFCLGDDSTQAAVAPGFVLEWSGDTTKPSYQAEKR